MSLPDFKNPVRISVSFDPFPRRWFSECNHASALACRLSLMLTVFFIFFIHILTVSGKPPCIYIPLSNVNEHWYTHLNDIKKFTSVTWPGRVDALKASSGPLLTVTNTHGFLLQHSCFQEAVWVALPVLIISKSSGFSIWVSKPIMFDS